MEKIGFLHSYGTAILELDSTSARNAERRSFQFCRVAPKSSHPVNRTSIFLNHILPERPRHALAGGSMKCSTEYGVGSGESLVQREELTVAYSRQRGVAVS